MEETTFYSYWNILIFILDIDLPSLHTMFWIKFPSMDFQNALSTVVVSYTVLLLIKKLIFQQKKCGSGPSLMEFTGLTMLLTNLKQLF